MRKRVLGMVMAGGRGTRLFPLTRDRAKPAVPFGGKYRIIDFVLSNFLNSGISSIYVLTQFMSQSLTEHIQAHWALNSAVLKDNFIIPVPAQMRTGESWFRGTADAIFQNLNLVREGRPHLVAIFGADHIYRMDISQMLTFHEESRADVTVAGIPVAIQDASAFGVMQVDGAGRITDFQEKPAAPPPMPSDPARALCSMGNYVFSARVLVDVLERDARSTTSSHDFGKDILPSMIERYHVACYNFEDNEIPGRPGRKNDYWRDVGTIEAYYDAHMDLRDVVPAFDLYNPLWPIRSARIDMPPAKFVHESPERTGRALNSIVCDGTILSGCLVRGSVLSRNIKIHSYAEVIDSIIFDGVEIGERARVSRAIIDKNVKIPAGTTVGHDPVKDGESFFVSDTGIVVIPKQPRFEGDIGVVDL